MKNIVKNKKGEMTMDKLAQITADGFLETDKKINELKEDMSILKENVNKILTVADSMAGQFAHWKQENAFGAGVDARQNEQLKNHEVRIKKLETV